MHSTKKRNQAVAILAGIFICVFVFVAGCGGEGSGASGGFDRSNFACKWEESKTTRCDGFGFKPYFPRCEIVDFEIRDDLTPQTFCDLRGEDGLFCQAGCCINSRVRNMRPSNPSCPTPETPQEVDFVSTCDLDCFDNCSQNLLGIELAGQGPYVLTTEVILGTNADICFDSCGCTQL